MSNNWNYCLAPGVVVQIKRNSGLVHPAVVSAVDWTDNVVTVEWYQGSGIKGKNISVEDIVALNPDIITRKTVPEKETQDK